MTDARIVNVVATTSVNQQIEFEKLRKSPDVSYSPKVYGGNVAYFKNKDMQGRVNIFSSGKMISVGTRSEKQAYDELKLAVRFLVKKQHTKPVELCFKTQNLVVVADLKMSVNLEKVSESPKTIYEPEQFPGAILYLENIYKVSVLLFASGKAILLGLKSEKWIPPIVTKLTQFIKSNQ